MREEEGRLGELAERRWAALQVSREELVVVEASCFKMREQLTAELQDAQVQKKLALLAQKYRY